MHFIWIHACFRVFPQRLGFKRSFDSDIIRWFEHFEIFPNTCVLHSRQNKSAILLANLFTYQSLSSISLIFHTGIKFDHIWTFRRRKDSIFVKVLPTLYRFRIFKFGLKGLRIVGVLGRDFLLVLVRLAVHKLLLFSRNLFTNLILQMLNHQICISVLHAYLNTSIFWIFRLVIEVQNTSSFTPGLRILVMEVVVI